MNIAIEGSLLSRPMCGTTRYMTELIRNICRIDQEKNNVYVIALSAGGLDNKIFANAEVIKKITPEHKIDI